MHALLYISPSMGSDNDLDPRYLEVVGYAALYIIALLLALALYAYLTER